MKRFWKDLGPSVFITSMISYGLTIFIVFLVLYNKMRFPNCEKVYIVLGAIIATIIASLVAKYMEVFKLWKIHKSKTAHNYVANFKYREIR